MIPKPGDKIIVTDSSMTGTYGKEYTVIDGPFVPQLACGSEHIWVKGRNVNGIGEEFWLLHMHYEVLEEDGVKVGVGDRVIITDPATGSFYCQILTVRSVTKEVVYGVAEDDYAGLGYTVVYGSFRLLQREPNTSQSSSICPDCNNTGKIQLFTSTVKCHCGVKI